MITVINTSESGNLSLKPSRANHKKHALILIRKKGRAHLLKERVGKKRFVFKK